MFMSDDYINSFVIYTGTMKPCIQKLFASLKPFPQKLTIDI